MNPVADQIDSLRGRETERELVDPDSKHKDLKETFTIERMIPRERSTCAR
jgi:hypothetical protein